MTNLETTAPIAVNYHLYKPCNYRCKFCFATFRDIRGQLELADARELLGRLRAAGTEKLTFAGGEPTLHPHIGALLSEARELGFTTALITNGARLPALLESQAGTLDWIGLSVDSAIERVEVELGRGRGDHVARSITLADAIHAHGVRLKLNSVITALNWQEDMHDLVRRMKPARWKVFQVLPITGQNDGDVEPLLITAAQFQDFVERHADLADEGLGPIAESNEAMTGSYAMIDPIGRFFGNHKSRYVYSPRILEVGVDEAIRQVGFELERLIARGGLYQW
jgi:radical S-adenosyl methionine domain-containing protein 2